RPDARRRTHRPGELRCDAENGARMTETVAARRASSVEIAEGVKIMKTSCVSGLVAMFMAAALASAQRSSPKLLVLNKEEATLAIVDPESGTILARVPVGRGPHELVTS